VSRQTQKDIAYRDLPEGDYAAILASIGLPPELAGAIASWDAAAAKGALFDDSRQLSRLIGRPTTPLAQAVQAALT
jgi:NAD(P)H dehydrogenase (quinone)